MSDHDALAPSHTRREKQASALPPPTARWLRRAAYPGTMALAFAVHAWLVHAGWSSIASAYAAAVLGAACVATLERVIPYERRWRPEWDEVRNDLLFMVAVQMVLPKILALIAAVTVLRVLEAHDATLAGLWPHRWPLPLQLVMMLLVAELFRYWLHFAAHNVELLWRFHAVHHSPHRLYWLNVGRFHPIDKALQFLLDLLPFLALGVGESLLSAYLVFYAVNGFFQHSNVDARYGPLNYVVSGAQLHRWHHSSIPAESNTNYGNNLIVWDFVFGTWFLPSERRVGELGLINRAYPQDFVRQMAAPFVPGLDKQQSSRD